VLGTAAYQSGQLAGSARPFHSHPAGRGNAARSMGPLGMMVALVDGQLATAAPAPREGTCCAGSRSRRARGGQRGLAPAADPPASAAVLPGPRRWRSRGGAPVLSGPPPADTAPPAAEVAPLLPKRPRPRRCPRRPRLLRSRRLSPAPAPAPSRPRPRPHRPFRRHLTTRAAPTGFRPARLAPGPAPAPAHRPPPGNSAAMKAKRGPMTTHAKRPDHPAVGSLRASSGGCSALSGSTRSHRRKISFPARGGRCCRGPADEGGGRNAFDRGCAGLADWSQPGRQRRQCTGACEPCRHLRCVALATRVIKSSGQEEHPAGHAAAVSMAGDLRL
jgi:hypothetical protein